MAEEPGKDAESKQAEERLRDNETFLEMLLDAIPIPVFYKDRQGRYLGFNQSYETFFGATRDKLVGKSVFDISPQKLAEIYYAKDNELFEGGGIQRYESQVKNMREELRDVIFNKAAFTDSRGEVRGLIGAILDITDRKQAEEAQQRLNRELRAISSCHQTMMRANDEQTLLNDICRIICDEAGYRLAWVGYAERDEAMTVRPAAWAGNSEDTAYLTGSRISWSGDTPYGGGPAGAAIRSGEIIHIQDIASDPGMIPWRESALERGYRCCLSLPLRNEHRNVFGALLIYSSEPDSITPEEIRLMEGLAEDLAFGITVLRTRDKRRQAEEALGISEEKYRAIFYNSPLGIFRSTVEGKFLEVNPALARMVGYNSPEEMVRDIHDIGEQLYFRPEERRKIVSQQLNAAADTIQHLAHYRRKDGSECSVNLYLKTVRDASGAPLFFDGIVEDMTERNHAEAERAKLQDQLLQAQKMDSIGRLAGGIAHDFNNMLGVIIGYTELCLRKIEPSHPLFNKLEGIRKAAGSSADLTRQLLAFARKQTITPALLDLNETVEGMLKMLRRLIGEDIHLVWLPGAGVHPVKVDPSQIDQILANLCVNARDAIQGVGRITIKTENITLDEAFCAEHPGIVSGDYVRLSVNDNGCGMDDNTIDKVFEPFFTTKETGKGTGLGLATVYGIVKQNNGFIDIDSQPGHGTTFDIYLPRHQGETTDTAKELPEPLAACGDETVLVVEDEPAILDITKLILKRCGYQTLTALSADEGIRIAKEHEGDIHLLITDVIMPGMNGRDLAQAIASIRPQIKQLFMSGYSDDAITHQGVLETGVNFIEKPFSMQALATKVRNVLDGQQTL